MKLSDFFKKANTKNIVINTDIDGFLSGMILQKYYGCKVVGFSDSDEYIWLSPEIKSIDEPVYIDIFINKPEVYSIDQHIIAYDATYIENFLSWGTKMNPNLDIVKTTYKKDYTHKFPFGTVHYLIALMKQDGIDVEFNDLATAHSVKGKDGVEYHICPGQVILRADDALHTTLAAYKVNASKWWEKLKAFDSETIDSLCEYMDNECSEEKSKEYKAAIGKFFLKGLECDGRVAIKSDGSFRNITKSDNRTLQPRIFHYSKVIGEIVGMEMDLPKEVKTYKGTSAQVNWSKEKQKEAVTFAFIYGPGRANGFSYTKDFKLVR
ncbi:MAG: hypothetical protein IJ397_03870 [Lachnospiraceae bacterium]|nr:hypothetical protein [Lachnospiraceae bacterium]